MAEKKTVRVSITSHFIRQLEKQSFDFEAWARVQKSDPGLALAIECVEDGFEKEMSVVDKHLAENTTQLNWANLRVLRGVLFRLSPGARGSDRCWQMLVPEMFREAVVLEYHSPTHEGVEKTYKELLKGCYWPHCRLDVVRYLSTCPHCNMIKYQINEWIQQ